MIKGIVMKGQKSRCFQRRGEKKAFISQLFIVLFFIFLTTTTVMGAEEKTTILTAERINETITIDGYLNESSWKTAKVLQVPVFDGKIGNVDVLISALYNDENIYLHIQWPDRSQSDKLLWRYNGTSWIPPTSSDQDIFTLFFNIDDSVEGFGIAGCAITCHADRMHTNGPNETVDMWKWHAAYDNAAGYMTDEFLDDTLVIGEKIKPGYSNFEIDKTWQSHKLDAANSDYINERKNTKTDEKDNYIGPLYYEPDAVGDDAYYLTAGEIEEGEAVELSTLDRLNDGSEIPVNYTVPGYIQERPFGSAGDIDAKGVYIDEEWHLEIRRKLVTGNPDDIQFDIAKIYRFSIAVNNDSRGSANTGIGQGHSISLVAKTFEFGGTGSEEVAQLALVRDYLITAKAHVNRDESGLALSSVSEALVVFNRIREAVADVDPELFIHIRNSFVDARRNPSLENVDILIESIDLAVLTLQGKREAPDATLWLKILILWGKYGIYGFVALSIIVIYPIYRMLKIIKKPQFRNLGLFMLIIISPLLLEGVGRLSALLRIPFLQNFSFTTSESVTIFWVAAMYLAVYLGRIGFNEIDNLLKSLEHSKEELETRVDERTRDLKQKIEELEKWQRLTVGRELKMTELKREINELKEKLKKTESS
jgi:hypothetical protein